MVNTFPPSSSGSTNKVSSTKSQEGTYICLSYGKYVQGTIPMMRTKEVDVLEQVQSKDTARRSIQLSRSLNLQNLTSSTKVIPKCVWEVRGIKTIFNDERRPQNQQQQGMLLERRGQFSRSDNLSRRVCSKAIVDV
ncbi:hypothetical protein Bca52824_052561 [Brassica carinata]|uniref:Uncharacterized protein n=1 Tax=Brassica carinata TaxID=52824 RepID=A0A8X7UKW7_BRACI|nr:hypothetical protein Bca52824_052561 [Brassica carinata]